MVSETRGFLLGVLMLRESSHLGVQSRDIPYVPFIFELRDSRPSKPLSRYSGSYNAFGGSWVEDFGFKVGRLCLRPYFKYEYNYP